VDIYEPTTAYWYYCCQMSLNDEYGKTPQAVMLTSPSKANTTDRKFSGGYTSNSPWRERRPLPARCIPMQLDPQLLDPVNASLNYGDMCHEAIHDVLSEIGIYHCRNSAYRNSACRNSASDPREILPRSSASRLRFNDSRKCA
jgi:hypothetical protein